MYSVCEAVPCSNKNNIWLFIFIGPTSIRFSKSFAGRPYVELRNRKNGSLKCIPLVDYIDGSRQEYKGLRRYEGIDCMRLD